MRKLRLAEQSMQTQILQLPDGAIGCGHHGFYLPLLY
jgi:hypothetical protein